MGHAQRARRDRGRHPRVGADAARRHRGQRRAADDRGGPRRLPRTAPVDLQRLPALAGLAHPARWLPRRPPRPQADLRRRHDLVRRRLAALRAGTDRGGADRGPRAPGRRRRAAHPGQPGDDPELLPRQGPRPRDRRLVRAGRDRDGAGSAGRRPAGRPRLVALDLPHQPPAGRTHGVAGDPLGAGDARPPRAGPLRRRRCGAGVRGPGRSDLGADRPEQSVDAVGGRCRSPGRGGLPRPRESDPPSR